MKIQDYLLAKVGMGPAVCRRFRPTPRAEALRAENRGGQPARIQTGSSIRQHFCSETHRRAVLRAS